MFSFSLIELMQLISLGTGDGGLLTCLCGWGDDDRRFYGFGSLRAAAVTVPGRSHLSAPGLAQSHRVRLPYHLS